MYIVDNYKDLIPQNKFLNDDQYLTRQILQLNNVFKDEIVAIKDTNLNYIAISEEYAKTFELNYQLNTDDKKIIFNAQYIANEEIIEQEKAIINNLELQDSIFLFNKKKSTLAAYYVMRKRPIVNPHTNHVLGITINSVKIRIGLVRTTFMHHIFGWRSNSAIVKTPPKLTIDQQQVILCLLYGAQSRKEIAEILSKYTQNDVNEIRVKNLLQGLYDKFECGTFTQLMQAVVKSQVRLDEVGNSIENKNYIV